MALSDREKRVLEGDPVARILGDRRQGIKREMSSLQAEIDPKLARISELQDELVAVEAHLRIMAVARDRSLPGGLVD